MDRINAFVLILALIVAPAASLCGAASAPGKCPPFCPMMHRAASATAEQTDEMESHHGGSTKPDCLMKSGCGQTLDLGLASPLPPAVLSLPVELLAPVANGVIRLSDTIHSIAGFQIPPFQPPRA